MSLQYNKILTYIHVRSTIKQEHPSFYKTRIIEDLKFKTRHLREKPNNEILLLQDI